MFSKGHRSTATKMYNPDVIAYLYPYNEKGDLSHTTIAMPENCSRYMPAQLGSDEQDTPLSGNREDAARGDETVKIGQPSFLRKLPCLVLRFSQPPQTRHGLTVGRSPMADIRLPAEADASRHHFLILLDDQNELVEPGNVLVEEWSDDEITVKFGDFGLSTVSDDLKTFCGTQLYMAPEMPRLGNVRRSKRYSCLVDIWSLGVTLAHLEWSQLPQGPKGCSSAGTAMVRGIRGHKNTIGENKRLDFVLTYMLIVNPTKRTNAQGCYDRAVELFEKDPESEEGGERGDEQGAQTRTEESESTTALYDWLNVGEKAEQDSHHTGNRASRTGPPAAPL